MSNQYSRRSFLSGVMASGALSAGAIYLMPGGRSESEVTLRLVTGSDPTGARQALLDMWRHVDPRTHVELVGVNSGSGTERDEMLSKVKEAGAADVLNLDVIDIPEFTKNLTPVPLPHDDSFLKPTLKVAEVDGNPDLFWAVPFNTDVGMLFSRRLDGVGAEATTLSDVLGKATTGTGKLVAQFSKAEKDREAFVVNVLEHALAVDPSILTKADEPPYQFFELLRWQRALEPLQQAIAEDGVELTDNEDDSREAFDRDPRTRWMRNWPVKYRGLQGQVDVHPLPVGVLGGQSLALVANSRHPERARRLIAFLTSKPAQQVLAAYGLAPSLVAPYTDVEMTKLVPHLVEIRKAVEGAVLRPRHPRYRELAEIIQRHVGSYLIDGAPLQEGFIEEMRTVLS